MPLLGFTVLKDKLLDGSKTQTIRLPRKRPFKQGDKLYIYWKPRTKQCEKLGEGVISSVIRKKADDLNTTDAILDGFIADDYGSSLWHLNNTLRKLHRELQGNTEVDIITWNWITSLNSRNG